eukprot:4194078-Alexandrium_andersonii.AAC.1
MPLKSVAIVIGLPPPRLPWRSCWVAELGRSARPLADWPRGLEPSPGSGPADATGSQTQSAALRLQTTQRAA